MRCHLVFVLVAFPPPPVTSLATRLEVSKDSSDFATSRLIISSKRDRVFIRSRSRLRFFNFGLEAKPFGFSVGRE